MFWPATWGLWTSLSPCRTTCPTILVNNLWRSSFCPYLTLFPCPTSCSFCLPICSHSLGPRLCTFTSFISHCWLSLVGADLGGMSILQCRWCGAYQDLENAAHQFGQVLLLHPKVGAASFCVQSSNIFLFSEVHVESSNIFCGRAVLWVCTLQESVPQRADANHA